MAMKTPKEGGKKKAKPVNPYSASGTGYKHLTGAGNGRMVVSRPKAITKVKGKVVPLPKNALMDARSLPNVTIKSAKSKSKMKNPITSIGGYIGRTWDGKKLKPLTTSGTPAKIKNNTKFSGTTVIEKGSAAAKANKAAKKAVAEAAKKKAAAAKKTTPSPKKKVKTGPSKGTYSIGGISIKMK